VVKPDEPRWARGEATNNFGVYAHGLYELYALVGGLGAREVPAVHLPLPAASDPIGSWPTDDADPFTDPRRPLRLLLASDTRSLPRREQDVLLALAQLDGVDVYAIPGAAADDRGGV
jgi:hypothetical protein